MFYVLWRLLIGLAVGGLAKLMIPGKDPGGLIITMLLGVAGSFIGAWIGRVFGFYAEGQAAGFLMSLLGAIVLLLCHRLIRGLLVAA